jgi:hypothetical protein
MFHVFPFQLSSLFVARPISLRLLSILQLTRMALVFTAISNSICAALLLARFQADIDRVPYTNKVQPLRMAAIVVMSIGLYGFGMSLNDIIDRRRDQQLAPLRPLPSGRIGVMTAHTICTLLLLMAFLAGWYYALGQETTRLRDLTMFVLAWTAALIAFYDYAGKYLVALGICTLGLIRFFHAVIPAPQLPLVWHPLFLMNHTTLLSAVCYQLEAKRPPLTKRHWYAVIGGLLTADVVCVGAVWWKRDHHFNLDNFATSLWVEPGLIYALGAAVLFALMARVIRKRYLDPRTAGQTMMLIGLLYLIVYDVCFLAGYVSPVAASFLLLLLPAAYMSVLLMRWWSKLVSLSQKPTYQRAR